MPHKLLGISGALRAGSTNKMLLREAARLYGAADYVEADLNLPLYDGDLESESGLPEAVNTLVAQIAEADALLISTPEYNAGVTGVLKNALDWISRHSEKPMVGKSTALMSAAAGRAGGVRAQMMLRSCLVAFRPRIALGSEFGLANSSNEFDAEGRLTSAHYTASLTALMEALKEDVGQNQ
ncbi:NADPH-dependent FMN reductase [Shimia marina]|uniref:NADPH azoreductase n=1 Tax=Shimia marina TaxID=321267 RepID=A0A0P1FDY1_9RHOB|nr:NAD(P)H-dependent oxidoreductase [Shimia marina]CUH51597.1 NADPH azoreductase [Shimia marina]SFD45058.1 NAD(P)H-dependent FMN reductase [Shimia marina]